MGRGAGADLRGLLPAQGPDLHDPRARPLGANLWRLRVAARCVWLDFSAGSSFDALSGRIERVSLEVPFFIDKRINEWMETVLS